MIEFLVTYSLWFYLWFWLGESALLRTGNPLRWHASTGAISHVRSSGILQFISHYKRCKLLKSEPLVWGDELEYGILVKGNLASPVDLSVNDGAKLQVELSKEDHLSTNDDKQGTEWHPEYGSWMVEGVPSKPYSSDSAAAMMRVRCNMSQRRIQLAKKLRPDQILPTISCFPMMGVRGYPHTERISASDGEFAASDCVSDRLINPHPRFGALTRNIRQRRGSKVQIKLVVDGAPDAAAGTASITENNAVEGGEVVDVDAMAFGMGCSCLQVTIQCKDEDESRHLHDQLAVWSPLLHALSAATPAQHGRLLATDTRWGMIEQAVDDRTPAERRPTAESMSFEELERQKQPALAGEGVRWLPQSRYSATPLYITRSRTPAQRAALQRLNDLHVPIDAQAYEELQQAGVDDALARHVAHLFVRDPLVVFDDQIYLDDEKSLDHFENIQSTNWRSMRWKPPTLEAGFAHCSQANTKSDGRENSAAVLLNGGNESAMAVSDSSAAPPGWRVEFRSLEVQLTDFENAAFALLVVLLSKLILTKELDFLIPMSLLHENMRRAQMKDAVLTQKFWFRKAALRETDTESASTTQVVEMSLHEILNGACDTRAEGASFRGLLPELRDFIAEMYGPADPTAREQFEPYLTLLGHRASGRLPTAARWIRNFITRHPAYQVGSGRLTPQVADDLLQLCHAIGAGAVRCEALLGAAAADCVVSSSIDIVAAGKNGSKHVSVCCGGGGSDGSEWGHPKYTQNQSTVPQNCAC